MKRFFILPVVVFSLLLSDKLASQTPGTNSTHDESPPVKVISFEGNIGNGKITLQWTIKENEMTDRFDVEKSTDGVNFTIAALVFTSEKIGDETYMFYERLKKDMSIHYRLKLYGKTQDISYSKVLKF